MAAAGLAGVAAGTADVAAGEEPRVALGEAWPTSSAIAAADAGSEWEEVWLQNN